MLHRLVRPVKRKGSSRQQFVQRIPADVKASARGMKLHVPVGPDIIPITISPKADAIRLSLRASEASEVKVRHGTGLRLSGERLAGPEGRHTDAPQSPRRDSARRKALSARLM